MIVVKGSLIQEDSKSAITLVFVVKGGGVAFLCWFMLEYFRICLDVILVQRSKISENLSLEERRLDVPLVVKGK